jgi:hypothetical protein
MRTKIPISFVIEPLAVKPAMAAKLIAVSPATLYRLRQKRQIKSTRYGTIPVAELHRHLAAEIKHAA